jgi:hypothetical protein
VGPGLVSPFLCGEQGGGEILAGLLSPCKPLILQYFEEAKDRNVTAFKGTVRKFGKVSAVHLEVLNVVLVSLHEPTCFVSMSI